MGNAALNPADGDDFAEFDGIDTLGYRVLGVQPNSPGKFVQLLSHGCLFGYKLNHSRTMYFMHITASKAGLVSFFDFIVGANGEMLLGSGENLEEGEEYDDIDCKLPLRLVFSRKSYSDANSFQISSPSTSSRQPRKRC